MAKGYWVGHITVTDAERYKDYLAANAVALKKFGARFLVRGGEAEVRGGSPGGDRHIVLEFESYAIAKACYDSPEYQAALVIFNEASTASVVIVEGVE